MKSAVLVAAGALLGSAAAHGSHDRHQNFHNRRSGLELRNDAGEVCGCTTYVTTITGPPTLVPNPAPSTPAAASPSKPAVSSVGGGQGTPSSAPTPQAPAPTPIVSTYATPGTYTIPATTITVTDTTTVCGATTTSLTPGVNTYGGVTTSVVTATTITCPYATVETHEATTTSVIKTTVYTCPAGGEYTIVPPYTTSVPEGTVTHYPTPATYTPGTYTAPEQTVTITKTNDVYVCPAATPLGGAASTSPAAASPTPTGAVDGSYGSPSSTPAAGTPAAGTPSTPASSAQPSSTGTVSGSTGTNGAGFKTNGNQWAMTYNPYTSDGSCKDSDSVKKDLQTIKDKGFTTVRIYGTDCNGLESVGAGAKAAGLRLILGIYIKSDGIQGQDTQEQVTDIVNWGKAGNWDLVDLVVVGNECIFNGWCTASGLAGFITTIKSTISSAGLSTVKFTTTETLNILQTSDFSALCSAIDVIGVNVQPFFNSQCNADDAGTFVSGQLKLAEKACEGLVALNLEGGWPSQGSANGAAVPGTSQQAAAIKSILEVVGPNSAIYHFDNQAWKSSSGNFGAEPYFGCADQFELSVSGTLSIGGLSLSASASIGSDGLDVDLGLNIN